MSYFKHRVIRTLRFVSVVPAWTLKRTSNVAYIHGQRGAHHISAQNKSTEDHAAAPVWCARLLVNCYAGKFIPVQCWSQIPEVGYITGNRTELYQVDRTTTFIVWSCLLSPLGSIPCSPVARMACSTDSV